MKEIKKKIIERGKKIARKAFEFLKREMILVIQITRSQKGEGVIIYIIFMAIIALAVLGTQAIVNDTFSDAVNSFKTWIGNKLNSLFS